MSVMTGSGPIRDGLAFSYDLGSQLSFPKNVFNYGTRLYDWRPASNGRYTASADPTEVSPVGGVPLKMVVTNTDPYTPTYNSNTYKITDAAQGETWTASVYVKADADTTGTIFLFEANAAGTYTAISTNITNISTAWKRITVTRTLSQADTASLQIRLDGPDNQIGVTLWWDGLQLERNSTATDFTPNYNLNGKTLKSIAGDYTPTIYNGVYANNSFSFNGSTTYVGLGTDKVISLDRQGWTAEYWFKTDVASTLQHFNSAENDEFNANWLAIYGSKLAVWNRDPGYWRYGDTIIQNGVWYQAVFVCDYGGTNMRFYINGLREGGDHVGNVWNAAYSSLESRYIGRYEYIGSYSRYFDGQIEVVRLYDKPLSDAEVKRNFNSLRGRYGL